jgi:hypothetical protein
MAVFKCSADVLDARDRAIGSGMAYVHLRLDAEQAQQATGTLSLKCWEPQDDLATCLQLEDGRRLTIAVSRAVMSDCSRNHILRYQAAWPPTSPPTESPADESSEH